MNNNTIYIQSNKDYLMHYGVPGMKWGVRKSTYKSMSRKERKATKKKYKNELRDISRKRLDRYDRLTTKGYGLSNKERKTRDKIEERMSNNEDVSRKKQKQYWDLQRKSGNAADQRVAKEFTKKYGSTKMKEVNRQNIKDGAAVLAFMIGGTVALGTTAAVAQKKLGRGSAYRAGQRDAKKYMSYMNSGNMAKAAKVAKRYM